MNWSDFERAAPRLAEIGRQRFEKRNVLILGTLRADGSPRISAVNPFFVGNELIFGSMRSAKVADLRRDARCAIHSAIFDSDGSEGEFKLFGRAVEVADPGLRNADPTAWWVRQPPEKATVFAIDVARAVFVQWDWQGGTYDTTSWSEGQAPQKATRRYP